MAPFSPLLQMKTSIRWTWMDACSGLSHRRENPGRNQSLMRNAAACFSRRWTIRYTPLIRKMGLKNGAQKELGGAVVGTPAYNNDGVLYVGTFGGKLFALNAENGAVIWEYSTQDDGWIWSGPTLSDGVLYFGDLNGYFYAVDAENGTQNWQLTPAQLDGEIVGSPLVIEQDIYITTEEGILFKLDTDGKIQWSQPVGENAKVYTSPKAAKDLILVAPIQIDELLIAYNQDGVRQWTFIPAE